MDWKEFFKFNFKKGWILLILFILLVFSWFVLGMFQKTGASESIFRIVLLFIFALPISIVDRTFGTQGISSIWIIRRFGLFICRTQKPAEGGTLRNIYYLEVPTLGTHNE